MLVANQKVKRATLHAVITRADGTKEDLGMLGYTSSNPIKRKFMNMVLSIKDRFRSLKRR